MFLNILPAKKLSQIKNTVVISYRMLKIIWSVDKVLFIGSFVSSVIPAIVPFVNIYIYKLVIDLVVGVVQGQPLDLTKFYPLLALRIATFFIQDFAFLTQDFIGRVLWTKVPNVISQLVFIKASRLDIQYYENDKFRDLLEKARDSYNFRPQRLVENLFYALQSLISVIIASVAIYKLNAFLMVLIATVAIPEFFNQAKQSRLSWGIWDKNTPLRKRYGYLQHILQGPREQKEVKIFGLAAKFINEIKSLQEQFFQDNLKIARQAYFLNLLFNVFSTAVFVGVEVFVIFQAFSKRVTVGDISFYTGVVSNFQNGLAGLFKNINGIFESSLYLKSVFELLDLKPIIPVPENGIKLPLDKAPLIEFKGVNFTYPESEKKILNNFWLTIYPGEKVAFVGENGAGKSTIIKLLARFYDVDKGELLINGVNIKELDIDNWYKMLGVLFQDFNRYDHTVRENIEFGKVYQEVRLDEVVSAATSAGAHPMISSLKQGYEQMLGKTFEKGIELSGGQWQKIALSRAFLRAAPVLVLDEPTASIDAKAESEIFGRVEKLSKDKTVIIISHRFSTVRNADKIYVIEKGKIAESGNHQQLIKLNGRYANLFNLQAKGYR